MIIPTKSLRVAKETQMICKDFFIKNTLEIIFLGLSSIPKSIKNEMYCSCLYFGFSNWLPNGVSIKIVVN